jgi:hypothetical protein
MTDVIEEVARVGIAAWVGESDEEWGTPVLGMIGDELYLVEIGGSQRERVLLELIERHEVGEGGLGIEIVFFGNAGGIFASSVEFLERWPKSSADVPADVFIDNYYKVALTKVDDGDEIVMSVRHVLRPGAGPPKRRLRFRPNEYQEAISELAREARRLRDDLIAVAEQRAPEKVESLHDAFQDWPA